MSSTAPSLPIRDQLKSLDPSDNQYAAGFVELLLRAAQQFRVSDLHLQPAEDGLQVRWRIDGVLQAVGTFSPGEAADVVTRLKVLAGLLTYRTDVPQEGRLKHDASRVEMRVSTFPTIFGERAAVRLFATPAGLDRIDQLGLPDGVQRELIACIAETTGAVLITGPAGSGKTTTAYACLRHLVEASAGGRNIVSLEDPVEVAVDGVAQSQVNAASEFDVHRGLRSLLRQDPEVIFVGEIRDRQTAEVAFQAALTGQLVLSTFHAGDTVEAVNRLFDMGIEPYLLRGGIQGVVAQRLVRRLCSCAAWSDQASDKLDLPIQRTKVPVGCQNCQQTGYRGRIVLAEVLRHVRAVADHDPADDELAHKSTGRAQRSSLWLSALEEVRAGRTSATEIRRTLGFGQPPHSWAENGET